MRDEARLIERVYRRHLGGRHAAAPARGADVEFGSYLVVVASELAVRAVKDLHRVEVDLGIAEDAA